MAKRPVYPNHVGTIGEKIRMGHGLWPIFNSAVVKPLIGRDDLRRHDAVALHRGPAQSAVAWRTVGGRTMPVARNARLAAGRGAERTRKRLPS